MAQKLGDSLHKVVNMTSTFTKLSDGKCNLTPQKSHQKRDMVLRIVLMFPVLSCVTDTSEDKPKIARKKALFFFRDLSLITCRLKATCVFVIRYM